MRKLTADEVCQLLKVNAEQLRDLRLRRDSTRFPAPLLGEHGLTWYEQDVAAWLDFVADFAAAGMTREALAEIPAPVYLASEPQSKTEQRTQW